MIILGTGGGVGGNGGQYERCWRSVIHLHAISVFTIRANGWCPCHSRCIRYITLHAASRLGPLVSRSTTSWLPAAFLARSTPVPAGVRSLPSNNRLHSALALESTPAQTTTSVDENKNIPHLPDKERASYKDAPMAATNTDSVVRCKKRMPP